MPADQPAPWDRAQLAAEALASAKADARARGDTPIAPQAQYSAERSVRGSSPAPAAGEGAGAEPGQRSPGVLGGRPPSVGEGGPPGGEFPPARRSRGVPGGRPPGATRPRRPRRDDPQPLSTAIDGLLGDQGWRTAAAVGSVFGRWPQIVGSDLAAHTRPDRLAGGELVVIADSTAWATQVRLLAGTLISRLNSELGRDTVTRVRVRGPEQPRRPGQWRVRGSRGPRDTYG